MNGITFQISQSEGGAIGSIYNSVDGHYWGIQSLSEQTALLIKYNPAYIPTNDVCGAEEERSSKAPDPIPCENLDNPKIRVLFLFSPAASAKIPSLPPFAAMIIGQLNTSSIGSGLSPAQVAFQSAGAMLLPGFLELPCSPITKFLLLNNTTAQSLKYSTYADIVCLIIDDVHGSNPPCDASGSAVNDANNASEAFCFAEITTARTQFKATHGIGHVIGLGHQHCINCPDIRCSLKSGSAHGFRINSTSRTIMADCEGTTRVPRWSADGVS